MGCDIHTYVEKKVEGVWQPVIGTSKWLPNRLSIMDVAYRGGRNYDLFSLLADVRNYDNRLSPIADPRGVPADISPEVHAQYDEWNIDAHSHSYFTLRELLEVDPQQFIESYADEFVNETIPILKCIAGDENPDDVRFIFWFDN